MKSINKSRNISKGIVAVLAFCLVVFIFISISGKSTNANPVVTHFWIGVPEGNWSDGSKWSLSSGGAACNCVPGPNDVAGFDANGNGAITLDSDQVVDAVFFMAGYNKAVLNPAGNSLTINDDLVMQSPATINFSSGDWMIGDDVLLSSQNGNPILRLQTANITIGGDWNNGGSIIIPGTSTVYFNGAGLNQNIFGNSTFFNLNVSPNSTKFLGLGEGTTTTITGNLKLEGPTPAQKVHIHTVNASGISVQKNSTINPSGTVDLENVSVQYNTNAGAQNPLTAITDQVVEMVPFSTVGWFGDRGPGGIHQKLETWILANAYSKNIDALSNAVTNGNPVRTMISPLGNTVATQVDGSKQPILETNAFNFNPTFSFDGDNDVLSAPDGWFNLAYYLVVKPESTVTSNLASNPSFFAPVSWITSSIPSPTGLFLGGGFVMGGDFTGTLVGEIVTHAVGSAGGAGLMYRSAQLDNGGTPVTYESKPHIFSSLENTGTNSQDIFANGKLISNGAHQTFIGFFDNPFNLGSYILDDGAVQSPCCFFEGQIPEVMSYFNGHTNTERQRIESYLALKYGVTLEAYNNERDYIASDGSIFWDDDDHPVAQIYSHDIAGIGQDNASALYQPKSKSINSDALITMGNPSDLENLEFLSWGNNNLSTSAWLDAPNVLVPKGYQALQRVWRVQESGDVGTVNVFIDQASLPSAPTPTYLLVSNSPNFMNATGLRMVRVGDEWQLENPYNFNNGQYVMIATKAVSIEFQHPNLSGPEASPVEMTNVFVQGELMSPISFYITDITPSWGTHPIATTGLDFNFQSPYQVTVPAGDYRTNVFAVELPLTIIDDLLAEDNEYTYFSITGLPAIGAKLADVNGDLVINGNHNYIIVNDDSVNVIVDPTSITMAEGGSNDYTIVLTNPPRPTKIVVIDIFAGSQLELAQGQGTLVGQVTFTYDNWNIPQTVTVWAEEDGIYEGIHYDTVTHAINTTLTDDTDYLLLEDIQSVQVTIYDNDANPDEEENSGGGSGGGGSSVVITGCVDEDAVNYNPAANSTSPDTPCLYILGESDPASNYLLDALSNAGECPYFSGFYKLGSEGSMVARWQAFLNVLLGINLTIDGKFGPSTDSAVKEYHEQWKDIILRPWGHTTPTGYIYKTTNATGNSMIGCPLGTLFISETGEYFNADTYNSAYNLQELSNELRNALNIQSAQLLDGYGNPVNDYTR